MSAVSGAGLMVLGINVVISGGGGGLDSPWMPDVATRRINSGSTSTDHTAAILAVIGSVEGRKET